MGAKNITSEKMNTSGFQSGGVGGGYGAGKSPRVLTKIPNPLPKEAKGPGGVGGKESKNNNFYKG